LADKNICAKLDPERWNWWKQEGWEWQMVKRRLWRRR
jgi:hypothetical protein